MPEDKQEHWDEILSQPHVTTTLLFCTERKEVHHKRGLVAELPSPPCALEGKIFMGIVSTERTEAEAVLKVYRNWDAFTLQQFVASQEGNLPSVLPQLREMLDTIRADIPPVLDLLWQDARSMEEVLNEADWAELAAQIGGKGVPSHQERLQRAYSLLDPLHISLWWLGKLVSEMEGHVQPWPPSPTSSSYLIRARIRYDNLKEFVQKQGDRLDILRVLEIRRS